MKIMDASIVMGSQRTYSETFEERTDFRLWVDPVRASAGDRVDISSKAHICAACTSTQNDDLVRDMGLEVSLKRLITEILSGRKVETVRPGDLSGGTDSPPISRETGGVEQSSEGWGLDYSHETVYREQEAVAFSASGVIRTADGRELAFNLRLDMNREYLEQNSIRIRAGDALKDPLIINFDGTAAQLGGRAFAFDIDGDGVEESLPSLSAGKGYLAIDLNGDGVINNGTELFGPSTGSGFRELSSYDTDGNGWIDENDDALHRFSVLSFNEEGQQVLRDISEAGIGAIHTSSIRTDFDMKDPLNGNLLGRVRSTGIYLSEAGTVGTIQQVDLKV